MIKIFKIPSSNPPKSSPVDAKAESIRGKFFETKPVKLLQNGRAC